MSNTIDSIAKLLKDKFKFSVEILNSVKEIRVGETNATTITNNIFMIGSDELRDPNVLGNLQSIFSKSFDGPEKDIYFSNAKSYKRLPVIKNATQNSEELAFFCGKIPDLDLVILNIAIVHESLRFNGNTIEANRIKNEACSRYGELARNILNIHSSGYFESTIKPLYQILEQEGENYLKSFHEMYKIIVHEAAFTLFVATNSSIEDSLEKLKEKIEVNKSYGAYKINIHGINSSNVEKIKKLIELIKDQIADKPIYIQSDQAITVKIKLKRDASDLKHFDTEDLVSIAN